MGRIQNRGENGSNCLNRRGRSLRALSNVPHSKGSRSQIRRHIQFAHLHGIWFVKPVAVIVVRFPLEQFDYECSSEQNSTYACYHKMNNPRCRTQNPIFREMNAILPDFRLQMHFQVSSASTRVRVQQALDHVLPTSAPTASGTTGRAPLPRFFGSLIFIPGCSNSRFLIPPFAIAISETSNPLLLAIPHNVSPLTTV